VFNQELEITQEHNKLLSLAQKNLCTQKELELLALYTEKVTEINWEELKHRCYSILSGLGFLQEQFCLPVSNLSVGWKMRLALAKILLLNPDFYLFDEPTNHLDIVAKDWFLDFLKNISSGFILVSHDRYFLDHACANIIELSRGHAKVYTGNYTHFLEQKEQEEIILRTKYKEQQREIKRKTETIERFRYKATKAKMAQSMLKSLSKIDLIELEPELPKLKLSFPHITDTGKIVLSANNLSKNFGDKTIFNSLSLEINRQEKVALVAANGKGKSTLLNTLVGKYKSDTGNIAFGHNVKFVYFEQDQERSLNPENTILQEIETVCTTSEQRIKVRSLLGCFLFSGDDCEKKIKVLSGGEKNRVAMVKILLQDANFLILDEPTNHLDIQSKEILLSALKQYPGTILFVSHDRTFLDGLATRILELTQNKIFSYKGNYESYLYQKSQEKEPIISQIKLSVTDNNSTKLQTISDNKKTQKLLYDLKKKTITLERKIESKEKERDTLYKKYEEGDTDNNGFKDLNIKVTQVTQELDNLYEEWEELHAQIKKLT
jgi:ATP-binding cassette subfamily F protein 3